MKFEGGILVRGCAVEIEILANNVVIQKGNES